MAEAKGSIRIRTAALTDVGNVRPHNEDAFIAADLTTQRLVDAGIAVELEAGPQGILLAVADGMGGALAGEVASSLVIDSIRDSLDDPDEGNHIVDAIKEATATANRAVWDAAQDSSRKGMGATLTAVLIRGPLAHIAQVGDSRAYLIRRDQIRQVTKDQSYVAVLVEAGVMTREQAEASPYKNAILQAMGTKPDVKVAIGRLELRRGDVFLVCSDGLWGKVADDELRAIVKDNPLVEACNAMIALAKERGGEDNITVVLGELFGDGLVEPRETVTKTYQSIDPGALNL